jgi:hypothetical protein
MSPSGPTRHGDPGCPASTPRLGTRPSISPRPLVALRNPMRTRRKRPKSAAMRLRTSRPSSCSPCPACASRDPFKCLEDITLAVCKYVTWITPRRRPRASARKVQTGDAPPRRARPVFFLEAIYGMWITRRFPIAKIFVSIISPVEGNRERVAIVAADLYSRRRARDRQDPALDSGTPTSSVSTRGAAARPRLGGPAARPVSASAKRPRIPAGSHDSAPGHAPRSDCRR